MREPLREAGEADNQGSEKHEGTYRAQRAASKRIGPMTCDIAASALARGAPIHSKERNGL